MDFADDTSDMPDEAPIEPSDANQPEPMERDKALVQEVIRRIKEDKEHHKLAFKRMHRDMHVAMWGSDETWGPEQYRANIVGRHVKMKTAALYAKNPKATAKRRETLDFAVWDENPQSLMLAFQTVQQAVMLMQQAAAMPAAIDQMGAPVPVMPELPPGLEQAQAIVQDFQQGMERRQFLTKYGKTLEILFTQALREQKPLDFKSGMKTVVRRANTTGVGYVEIQFQREYGPRPGITDKLADARARLDHLRNLTEQVGEGDIGEDDAELAELERSVADIQAQPEIILREGIVFDFPASTKVIPDRMCTALMGFVGARHLTIEYSYTVDEVKEMFGVDLGKNYTGYSTTKGSSQFTPNDIMDDEYEWSPPEDKKGGLVCVWKHYDKPSGLVYFVADGYNGYLREPAAPDVFVEDFWPLYALTFNAVESEKELFPPSDVTLLLDMQREYNRSRQGMREHRQAARPRWVYANGAFGSEEDTKILTGLKPFEAAGINIDASSDIRKMLQAVPVPGVDPNLYETSPIFADFQLVGGAQEAQYGGVAKATATESAIAANSTQSSDGSSIDDLDSFLTCIARAAGQVLQREMSPEKVMAICGPGAVWPEMSLADIANEVFLEVEAGSTGKPNQAIEVANMQKLLPLILQIPGIEPTWLAREVLRRMDDRLDLTEALAAGMPSIMAMNQQTQATGAQPQDDPNAQGAEGSQNAPKPAREGGSQAAFGSNQTEPGPAALL